MHRDHDIFVAAIHSRTRVQLAFVRKDGAQKLTRLCAPMDYGPVRTAKNHADRYHLWDYEGDEGPHPLSLLPDQIVEVVATEDTFDPADFVTWSVTERPWFAPRDWGAFS